MVKQKTTKNQDLFICEDCKLAYKEETWATKCEKWCKKHKTCNLEITKHSTVKE